MSDKKELEFKIGEICGDCESSFSYGWSRQCDHDDWHVIKVKLSDNSCENCHTVYHQWIDANDLHVEWDHIKELIDMAKDQGFEDLGQQL